MHACLSPFVERVMVERFLSRCLPVSGQCVPDLRNCAFKQPRVPPFVVVVGVGGGGVGGPQQQQKADPQQQQKAELFRIRSKHPQN